jgi:hypothetical protein
VERRAAAWGWVDLRHDRVEDLYAVSGFSDKEALRLAYVDLDRRGHFMRSHQEVRNAGVWYRVDPVVHAMHYQALLRGLAIKTQTLRDAVTQGWRSPPPDRAWLTLAFTGAPDSGQWSAWWTTRDQAMPCRLAVVTDDDPIGHLMPAWPIEELAGVSVVVVGVGSIGSTAAESLAAAGVGCLVLVDPDRLYRHNLPRHRLGEAHLGRFKANALGEELTQRHPGLAVVPVAADVARDADLMRPLFAAADVIVCAADGVEPRRVANHLARRAGVPLVLVAVLEDGAIGELVRVRPRTGCLLCLRRRLTDDGVLDPEPGLDLGYGTGPPHRPMTASPPDLRLMGELAAKATLATVLEARGRWSQRLPGDWAVVGLQPASDAPPPFDVETAGAVRWETLPPRRGGCPTCAEP